MKRALWSAGCLAVLVAPLLARWAGPNYLPLERLLENFRQRLAEAPEDPHRHYQLGRACSLAFALNLDSLEGSRRSGTGESLELELAPLAAQRGERYGKPAPLAESRSAERNLELLSMAVRELSIAAASSDAPAAYDLGLAYALASGAHLAPSLASAALLGLAGQDVMSVDELRARDAELANLATLPPEALRVSLQASTLQEARCVAYLDARRADPDPRIQALVGKLLSGFWLERALASYLKAYQVSLPVDLARKNMPTHRGDSDLGLQSMIAYESGQAVLELAQRLGPRAIVSEAVLEALPGQLTQLESLKRGGFVTPIVLDLAGPATLAQSLAPERVVHFDLDGDGFAELRTWVQPRTGLLVWDPQGLGTITSGRQLFGDATWWMFFHDGYEALDALDDDRDGWLFGDELAGMALWRDANGDAVSNPGEVEDLRCLGVVALATRADKLEGLSPGASRGAWMRDGRCLPTWDWVAEPVPETPLASSPDAAPCSEAGARATYEVRQIEGWSVHVDSALLEPDSVGPDALELLAVKLFDVRRAVPTAALEKLHSVPIWLSADDSACACACYHVSADWLESNGHDPAKARAVEITRADLFLDWSRQQPSMVLHELAHGWFDRELGGDDPRLSAALERARASGLYDSVLRWNGAREKHYALGNETEFLAEMSECWLGTNDYWPFVRAELLDADPQTAALMAEIWGE